MSLWTWAGESAAAEPWRETPGFVKACRFDGFFGAFGPWGPGRVPWLEESVAVVPDEALSLGVGGRC